MGERTDGITTAESWRAAQRASRAARAEPLRLPSGTVIMAARPEPLEWIVSGRIPQRLLTAALEDSRAPASAGQPELSREEVLELAQFAAHLVKVSVVEPAIGDGPDEIRLDDIPIEDRAFIFEWACRVLGDSAGVSATGGNPTQEDLSSPSVDGLGRFRAQ